MHFLLQTEVHVYSFAVAANVLMTFFPFLVAMVILCRSALHWNAAVQMIFNVVNEYFPPGFGVDFPGFLMQVAAQDRFRWISALLLLFTSNGIFVPLEVALNRIWRVHKNRNFLVNQIVSLALIFVCGGLVLLSVTITTVNVRFFSQHFGATHEGAMLQSLALKISAVPLTMLIIFFVYWVLPNARIPVKRIIPAAIVVGLLLELAKYVNIVTWPYLRAQLQAEVPPFKQSISIIVWSFVGTLIILAGAEWSARVELDLSDAKEESTVIR